MHNRGLCLLVTQILPSMYSPSVAHSAEKFTLVHYCIARPFCDMLVIWWRLVKLSHRNDHGKPKVTWSTPAIASISLCPWITRWAMMFTMCKSILPLQWWFRPGLPQSERGRYGRGTRWYLLLEWAHQTIYHVWQLKKSSLLSKCQLSVSGVVTTHVVGRNSVMGTIAIYGRAIHWAVHYAVFDYGFK